MTKKLWNNGSPGPVYLGIVGLIAFPVWTLVVLIDGH